MVDRCLSVSLGILVEKTQGSVNVLQNPEFLGKKRKAVI